MEKFIKQEELKNERIKTAVLAIITSVFLITFVILSLALQPRFFETYHLPKVYFWAIIIMAVFIIRELIVKFRLERLIKKEKKLPSYIRYANTFFETSFPTVFIILSVEATSSFYMLLSPAVFFYVIFIILSTLTLDFKLAVFSGAVAAIEYMIISYIYIARFPEQQIEYLGLHSLYIGKAVILFVSGVIAGFVAWQLRRRVLKYYQLIIERNKIYDLFGQQVSHEIVEDLLISPDEFRSKEKFVCIMFLDIRDFTKFSEKKTPEEIINFQNKVFGPLIEIISRHNGIINQFLGDGFMATFGAPISYGNVCKNAINASLEILQIIERQNEDRQDTAIRIGIGLHAGTVVVGNVGTALRKQYSVTGKPVIIASRIEQLNKSYNSQLLLSERVYKGGDIDICAESLGKVMIKGLESPIDIYKLA